ESGLAWQQLMTVLRAEGRFEDAAFARKKAVALLPGSIEPLFEDAYTAMYREDYQEADRSLALRIAEYQQLEPNNPAGEGQESTRWWQIISLRNQGRLEEALLLARLFERWASPNGGIAPDSVASAQVLFEMGRPREAAERFLELAGRAA